MAYAGIVQFTLDEVRQQKFVVRHSHPIVTKGSISNRTKQQKQSEQKAETLMKRAAILAAIRQKEKEATIRELKLANQYWEVQ